MSGEDVDTAPIVASDRARTEFRSVLADPGEEVEIFLEPELDMSRPLLFMSTNPLDADVLVVRVSCGQVVLEDQPRPVADYKFGSPTHVVVTRGGPIKINLRNRGARQARIGASLVAGEEKTGE
jgi:hypothetical protein